MQEFLNPFEPSIEVMIGDRACYKIPERGGWSYGFGDVIKLNKKSIVVLDKKFPDNQKIRVDKALVYKVNRFES